MSYAFQEAPVAELRAAYIAWLAEQGRPVDNPAEVDVLGLRRWGECWVGAVVTPIVADMVLLPALPHGPLFNTAGQQEWNLPSGPAKFSCRQMQGVPIVHAMPLLEKMDDYSSPDAIARAALMMLEAFLNPASAALQPGTQRKPLDDKPAGPVSRRDFLRGRFFGR